MLPLSSNQPTQRIPFVTWTLIAINVAVSVYLWSNFNTTQLRQIIIWYGTVPGRITGDIQHLNPDLLPALFTLISSQFLHGGIFHLLGNMLYLKIFGEAVEMKLGWLGYLLFYLVAGVVADVAHIVFAERIGGLFVPAIGASGAIAGVLGAYFAMFPGKRVTGFVLAPIPIPWPLKLPTFLVLGWWFVEDYLLGLFSVMPYSGTGLSDNVAHWAHIGGFVMGMIAVLPLLPGIRKQRAKEKEDTSLPDYSTRVFLPKSPEAKPSTNEFDLDALNRWRSQQQQPSSDMDLLDDWRRSRE